LNHTFTDADLDALLAYGTVVSYADGDELSREGTRNVDALVVLEGQIDIHLPTTDGERRVGWMERGQFAGDITLVTGQATLVNVRASGASKVLRISHADFQRLLVEDSHLSDIFVRVLTARRAWAKARNLNSIVLIGSAFDRQLFALRDLMTKHNVPHCWLDPERDAVGVRILAGRALDPSALPVAIVGDHTPLVQPSVADVSMLLGLDSVADDSHVDLVVVGAGPAGLACAVYAASEGLSVIVVDSKGPGGQAGTSSKIENYLGFPMGISGRELAERATVQAQKFGALFASPATVKSVAPTGSHYCVRLADGRAFDSRAVVVASGADYRRLPIEGLEGYEGRGIYYGATAMEAQLCARSKVCVVGAGNSAGQGAVFLSETCEEVHVLYRRADIRETMSEYLVRRLESTPNIHLHPQTEIEGFEEVGGRLAGVQLKGDGAAQGHLATPFVFLFIGAAPCTDWVPDAAARDRRGFLLTGVDLESDALAESGWPLDRAPSRFETSIPRFYAVGDVRSGGVKRVASAVGEGSGVIADVHRAIAEA
ncbi:MAG: FAD-dependent oxidoreductase, partial [Myxococcota bacterium]